MFEDVEPTLEYLKECVEDDVLFETSNCKALLDYITNLENVADKRMQTIIKIENYCIDEKEDLIGGREVCEDIIKIIDELKGDNK